MLDQSAVDVLDAIEAAAVPDDDAKRVMELGGMLGAALARGSHAMSIRLSPWDKGVIKAVPLIPRVSRLVGDGVLLAAGPFQPLWRIYRDAASLLLAQSAT